MFTRMFTMTESGIKRVLRMNKRRGVRPYALKHIADACGVPRSMVTTAVKTPSRYPGMRRRIEAILVESARGS